MEKGLRRVYTEKHEKKGLSEYDRYKLQTRGEYEDLMMEFEFRCKRAAMMHYYEASRYDNKIFYVELASAIIGGASMTSLGTCLLGQTPMTSFKDMSSAGPCSAVGLGLVFLIQMAGKGTAKILPSFSHRKLEHVTCAAAWQKLAMKTRSYRIRLDDPELDVDTYASWFQDLIIDREKLCSQVTIPQSTYKLYSDPLRVYTPMKQRRLMFIKYLQLEDMGVEDVADIKDFKLDKEI